MKKSLIFLQMYVDYLVKLLDLTPSSLVKAWAFLSIPQLFQTFVAPVLVFWHQIQNVNLKTKLICLNNKYIVFAVYCIQLNTGYKVFVPLFLLMFYNLSQLY